MENNYHTCLNKALSYLCTVRVIYSKREGRETRVRRYDARELKRSRIIPLVKETLLVADFNPLPPISYNCSRRGANSATISYRESRSETKGGKFKNLPPTKGVDETLEGQKIGGKVERGEGRGKKTSTRPSCHVQLSRLGGFKGSVREPSRV